VNGWEDELESAAVLRASQKATLEALENESREEHRAAATADWEATLDAEKRQRKREKKRLRRQAAASAAAATVAKPSGGGGGVPNGLLIRGQHRQPPPPQQPQSLRNKFEAWLARRRLLHAQANRKRKHISRRGGRHRQHSSKAARVNERSS
jgi:hypothetical protein